MATQLSETIFQAVRDHVFECDEAEVRAKIEHAITEALELLHCEQSLGERLYEACARPFSFRGPWSPTTKPASCANYQKAARAFAQVLLGRR